VYRCAKLIGSLTGARPSPGFVHGMLARAAAAAAAANKAIRALIILAQVACADETPIRAGPGRPGPNSRKRYLLAACTRLLTYYFPGDRSMCRALPQLDLAGPDRRSTQWLWRRAAVRCRRRGMTIRLTRTGRAG
jgi:transposase